MKIIEKALAAIEKRRQVEADTKKGEIVSAGDAQRKRIFALVRDGKEDEAIAAFYENAQNPRRDLETDIRSCEIAIRHHSLIEAAATAEADASAALSRIPELAPQIKQATSELTIARQRFPGRPSLDDYRALRAAERALQDLADAETVARETQKYQRERMRQLREEADGLGHRFDTDSKLAAPQNFALRSTISSDAPKSAARLEKVARLRSESDEARSEVERLDAEFATEQKKHDSLMTDYEKSKASEDSPRLSQIKFDLQTSEDRLRGLRVQRNKQADAEQKAADRAAALV